MNLVIRAQTLNAQPLSQTIVCRFDAGGGTIGRADTNTMTLPDPVRHISRLQAQIRAEGIGYAIGNAGATNPIYVNGHALGPGEHAPLSPGDQLRIGGYMLCVTADDAVSARGPLASAPAPRPMSRTGAGALDVGSANPFADLIAPAAADDVLAAHALPAAPAAWAAHPVHAPARLPEDFDPFADPPEAMPPSEHGEPAAAADADPLGAIGLAAVDSIDALFGLGEAPSREALRPFGGLLEAGALPAAGPAPVGAMAGSESTATDPFVLFGIGHRADPAGSVVSDHVPELKVAYRPPAIVTVPSDAAPRIVAGVQDPPREPDVERRPSTDGPDALWAAFCAGLGMNVPLARGLDTEQMRATGALLREAVEGTLRLMSVRASMKTELRAEVTTIRASNNNPLKFSPSVEHALAQILQAPLRGFLPGPDAMRDAMHDLVGHEVGVLAGMRAALAGVLGRFEPERLEERLVARSVLDTLVPGSRKARLWELYLQHFDAIRGDAQDDFQALFGNAFIAAYEAQLDALRPPRT